MSSSTPAVPLTPQVVQLEAELAERRAHLSTTVDELVTRLMPREILRREVEAAGFKLVAEGDFWRHPEDTRDFTTQPPTKPADEFVLRFQKPQ